MEVKSHINNTLATAKLRWPRPLNRDGRWKEVSNTAVYWQINRDFGMWPPNGGWPLNRGRTVPANRLFRWSGARSNYRDLVTSLRRPLQFIRIYIQNVNVNCWFVNSRLILVIWNKTDMFSSAQKRRGHLFHTKPSQFCLKKLRHKFIWRKSKK